MNVQAPILVTGAHRTGTTWVGKMLAASPQVAFCGLSCGEHPHFSLAEQVGRVPDCA